MKAKFSGNHINKLLAWFNENGQSYPWGGSPDPYSVWISEIMLQQTTVGAVVPYFKKWMALFPDLSSVASADEQTIMRSWEGLGYYSRARNIHATAKRLMKDYSGRIPSDKNELLSLPGIGPYTASAIMSIAFGKKEIVFDANVKRIFQRLEMEESWSPGFHKTVEKKLLTLLPENKTGSFNEALMQLGQQVCKVSSPVCPICPFYDICEASRQNRQADYPVKKKKSVILRQTVRYCFLWEGKLFLIQKKTGIGKDLWFLPSDKEIPEKPIGTGSAIALKSYLHFYTKYKETLYPKIIIIENPSEKSFFKSGSWFDSSEWDSVPVPSVYRSILNKLKEILFQN